MMRFDDNNDDEDLVFYDGTEEPETDDDDVDETESTGSTSNPFLSDRDVHTILGENDPDAARRREEERAKDRAWRHKTNRRTGVFGIDLLTMLTWSPYEFKRGCETFLEFRHLGQYRPDKDGKMPDPVECDKLYQDKKNLFQASLLSVKFLKSAVSEAIVFIIAVAGFLYGLSWLSAKFGLFKLLLVIAAFEVAWNMTKSFLRSLLSAMRGTHDDVLAEKKKADASKKAQQEAQKKAKEKERREAARRQKPALTEDDQPKEPIRPMGRGRYRRSGG